MRHKHDGIQSLDYSILEWVYAGMHALHLAGGALVLLYADVATILHRPVESRRIVIDVTTWYWHCMTGIWICILALLSFTAQ